MLYVPTVFNLLEVLVFTIPVLLVVAFVTVAERKTMASMQRRLGPNIVGYYGLLQAFADALKLLLKEYVSPTQANLILFFLGPIITLIFSLLGYAVIPLAPGLTLFDFNIGILYMLALSSMATYGILLAGWSANSKYAFLGSLRSTAQLISYELILTSAVFIVVFVTNSLNLTINIEMQKGVWLILPLLPVFIIFFISAIAETNRAPFDLAEAESELVSGFMTEHSSVIFVFFFLAEYANIVLICLFMTVLFLGGYNINAGLTVDIINMVYYLSSYMFYLLNLLIYYALNSIFFIYVIAFYYNYGSGLTYLYNFISGVNVIIRDSTLYDMYDIYVYMNRKANQFDAEQIFTNPVIENTFCGLVIAIKAFILVFIFIWIRASLPRIRYDQLMSYCWTVMLPIVFALIIFIPCIIYVLKIMPYNVLFF